MCSVDRVVGEGRRLSVVGWFMTEHPVGSANQTTHHQHLEHLADLLSGSRLMEEMHEEFVAQV
jgi:hypothetical protein